MANFGIKDQDGATQHRHGGTTTWKLPQFFTWCRLGRNNDDQNNQWRCQDGTPAIERAWQTKDWECKQLVHCIAVSMANAFGAWTVHFSNKGRGLNTIGFRKLVAKELMLHVFRKRNDFDEVKRIKEFFDGNVEAPSSPAMPATPTTPMDSVVGNAATADTSAKRDAPAPAPTTDSAKRKKKSAVSFTAGAAAHKKMAVPVGHYDECTAKDCDCGCGTKFKKFDEALGLKQRRWRCSKRCGREVHNACECQHLNVVPGVKLPVHCSSHWAQRTVEAAVIVEDDE